MNKKIRVLIVDDHPLFREALCSAVEAEEEYMVIGQVCDGGQAVTSALELKPDVIIMDLNLPVKSGVQAIAEILAMDPDARILAITSAIEDEKVFSAVQAGASGYILKDASRDQFMHGLKEVAAGNQFLPPEVSAKLARSVRQKKTAEMEGEQHHELLTTREKEILILLGEGHSNKTIAQKLFLSESTVRVHLFNILVKLKLEDRNQAILYAIKQK
jgi:two-component system, NarL family, response regulator LiaR